MTYVDADGVLSDFEGWASEVNPNALFDRKEMYKTIVENYRSCFLDSKPIKCGMMMEMVATDPEWFVLTSLPSYNDLKRYTKLTSYQIVEVLSVLKENKYQWFEQQGVPRCKVIVVDKRADKLNYCYSGDTLYDDYEKTCDEWNELGGIGVHVCR